MKKEEKTDKKDGIKVTIVTEENPAEFIKVKVNGTLNDVSSYKLYDSIDFEDLTGSFGLKHQVIIILKLSLKADGIKFQLAK